MEEIRQILAGLDWSPLFISIKTGIAATIVSFFLGIWAARKVLKAKTGLRAVLDGILTLPLVLPPTVAGFFLLLIFSTRRTVGSYLYTTFDIKIVQSLRSREFEPDGPNYTPRISGIMHIENGKYNYAMSILKSNNGNPDACNRYTFAYENPVAGEGHFIHTYKCDGNPLPSFEGEPKLVAIPDDMDTFADTLWNSLNADNKVSLFVRYIDIETGTYESKIINKNK